MRNEPFLPRRHSVRLPHFDYAQPGQYFVTICVHNMKPLFGKVVGHEVALSDLGRIAENCWIEIPSHFPNVHGGPQVTMPDHVHGIVAIQSPRHERAAANGENSAKDDRRARYIVPLREKPSRDFGDAVAGSIATIVGTFKAAVSRKARHYLTRNSSSIWQRGYYEHVSRDERDFQNVCEYISMNPARRAFELEYWLNRSAKR